MKTIWESRCLICDHTWTTDSCTESCTECGETDDIYSEEKEDMTVKEALELIVSNSSLMSLSYAIGYAEFALTLISYGEQETQGFKTQMLYVLNNLTHWRQTKLSTTTAAEIKECRAVLKKASV